MKTKEFMNGIAGMSMAATNQLDNTSRIKEVRRNIARIQTAMSKERKAN